MPELSKESALLIVGGGTFGLSTAWHAAKAGYKHVKVIDRWAVPSPASAGHDVNKIVRTEYANRIYSKLAQESIEAWQSQEPLASSKVFHKTGWVCLVDGSATSAEQERLDEAVKNIRDHGVAQGLEELPTASAIRQKVPVLTGEMKGWRGYWNSNAGWVEARRALVTLGRDAERLGVKFCTGPSGAMHDLLLEGEQVTGVTAEDGTVHRADRIILATGAWSESLVDLKGQVKSGAYILAHLRPSENLVEKYKSLPVICNIFGGYFFPPNEDGIIKIAANGSTQTNYVKGWRSRPGETSVPRDPGLHPTDIQPVENRKKAKAMLYDCAPDLAQEEIVWSALCHDTESIDHNFLICPHPLSPSTFFIATAGSGHAFKNFPILGKYVLQSLEGRLTPEHQEAWRWKPDLIGSDRDIDKDITHVDLGTLTGWRKEEDCTAP